MVFDYCQGCVCQNGTHEQNAADSKSDSTVFHNLRNTNTNQAKASQITISPILFFEGPVPHAGRGYSLPFSLDKNNEEPVGFCLLPYVLVPRWHKNGTRLGVGASRPLFYVSSSNELSDYLWKLLLTTHLLRLHSFGGRVVRICTIIILSFQ